MGELLVEVGAQAASSSASQRSSAWMISSKRGLKTLYSGPRGSFTRWVGGRHASEASSESASSASSGNSPEGASAASVAPSCNSSEASCEVSISERSPCDCSSASPSLGVCSSSWASFSSSLSSSSGSNGVSSAMSREVRRSRTERAKARWFSIEPRSPSRLGPALSSMWERQRSTILAAAAGGGAPVRRSRTISATASSIGASARSVMSSYLPPRW